MDVVVLSPHLDDAAFACGGTIAAAVAQQKRVLVATFGTSPPEHQVPANLAVFMDYATRLDEDRRAMEQLGAEGRAMGFVERVFRQPMLNRLHKAFRTPDTIAGFDALDAMRRSVNELLQEFPNALFLAPLGVGNHFDHVELFLAAFYAMVDNQAFERLHFYEEAYSFGLSARKQHFVTRRHVWEGKESPERTSMRTWATFKALSFARSGPPVETFLPQEGRPYSWTLRPSPMAEFEQHKFRAAFCYESQIAMLGGASNWGQVMHRFHNIFDGAEPLWTVSCP